MSLANAILTGLKDIWAHKFRSLLTMLGIILGVASLVGMTALVKGMENGIPYIGIVVATIPAVLLAWAECGPARAILVIIGVMIANGVAENIVGPKLIGKGLSISPLVVFLSFFFWSWVLVPLGMFLSMPLTVRS